VLGRVPFIENGAQPPLTKALADQRLFFTSQPSEISSKGPVITIGTLVDEFQSRARCYSAASIRRYRIFMMGSFGIAVHALPGDHGMDRRLSQAASRNLKVAFVLNASPKATASKN
jgi:hypothetical protein